MPIRDRVIWGQHNPFQDSRLVNLDALLRAIRRNGSLPPGVSGGSVFRNLAGDLPIKTRGYYKEYDVAPAVAGSRGILRLVLGDHTEVYITGDHYGSFRQIVCIPL